MKYTNAGFPPISNCKNIDIDDNLHKSRESRGEIKNFSLRTILTKQKKNLINFDDNSEELAEI